MKIWLLFFSLALFGMAASANAAQTALNLPFAPAPGAWERDFRMIVRASIQGEPSSTTSVRTVRRQEIEQEGDGWLIRSIPQKVEVSGVESPLDKTIQEILLGQVFSYQLDAQGQVVRVAGFDTLGLEVEEGVPEESQMAVKQVVNAETQRWRLKNQWQTEYAWLYTQPLTMGESYRQTKRLEPPDGPAMDFSQESIPVEGDEAQTVQVAFTSQAKPAKGADLRRLSSLEIEERGERVFALDSGLPLKEVSTRKVSVVMRGPEGPIRQERNEARHISYRKLTE